MTQVIIWVANTRSIDGIHRQSIKRGKTQKKENEKERKSQNGSKTGKYSTECTEMHLRGAVEFQVSLVHVSGRKRMRFSLSSLFVSYSRINSIIFTHSITLIYMDE